MINHRDTENTDCFSVSSVVQNLSNCFTVHRITKKDMHAVLSIKMAQYVENINCRRGGLSWEKRNVSRL